MMHDGSASTESPTVHAGDVTRLQLSGAMRLQHSGVTRLQLSDVTRLQLSGVDQMGWH